MVVLTMSTKLQDSMTVQKTPKDVFVEIRMRQHGETRDQAISLFHKIVNIHRESLKK